jgi:RNA polymerase sigma-70 factor (ECF subfamily)
MTGEVRCEVRRVKGSGKPERFLEHLGPLQRKLEGYCRRMVYSPDAVPDVLQSAIASAYRDFDLYAEGTNFPAWIFAYVHREIQNTNRRLRKHKGAGEPEDVAAPDAWHPPHELPVHRLLLDAPEVVLDRCDADLAGGVQSLRQLEREVLLLHAIGEFKYREIAEILDVPIGTVMSALARARHRVREHLARIAPLERDHGTESIDPDRPGTRGGS